MKRRRVWWVIAAVVIGAPLAWYLGSPLLINRAVDEAFPMSANATVPEGMTKAQAEAEMMEASKKSTATSETMPGEASVTVLARGTFVNADSFHRGSGTALVARVGTDRLLRFEEFRVTNGPNLFVYLAKHPQPSTRAEVDEGFVNIGALKGNIGAQNYVIPSDVRLDSYQSVVIYCRRFHVVFSTATLQAAR